jgi:dipeptidyl aminopeptidase/acylaminoacyl peptidase
MTRHPDPLFDQRLADWLEEDPDHAPRETVATVLAAFPSIPQRRALRAPWRSPRMNRFALAGVAIAAVAVIAVGGLMLLPRGGTDIGAPPVATPSPVPTTIPTATPAPTPVAYSSLPGWIVFEHFGQAPDGSTTTMDYDRRQVWLVKADGSGLHELAPGMPVDGKAAPDISPDGTKVVFSSWKPKSQVWEAGIDGGDPRLVSTDCSGVPAECQEWDPAYSPDGRRIAFAHSTDGGKASEIAIRDLETGEVTRFPRTSVPESEGWVAQPSWSPGGQMIAYNRNTQKAGENVPSDTRIWIVQTKYMNVWELATPAGIKAADPDWSPDGSRIVFATEGARELEGRAALTSVYTIRPDGTDPQVVIKDADGEGLAPTWMPDGKHILYWGVRTWNLVEPDGSNAAPVNTEKLTFFGDQLGYGYVATWQPTP